MLLFSQTLFCCIYNMIRSVHLNATIQLWTTVGTMTISWFGGKILPLMAILQPRIPFLCLSTEMEAHIMCSNRYFRRILSTQFEIDFSSSMLIGSRPFFTLANYTRRSPFLPSSSSWFVLRFRYIVGVQKSREIMSLTLRWQPSKRSSKINSQQVSMILHILL